MGPWAPPHPSHTQGMVHFEHFENVALEKLPLFDSHGNHVQGSVSITLVKMGGRLLSVPANTSSETATSVTPASPVAAILRAPSTNAIASVPAPKALVQQPPNAAKMSLPDAAAPACQPRQPNCFILVIKGLTGMHLHNFGGFLVEAKVIGL